MTPTSQFRMGHGLDGGGDFHNPRDSEYSEMAI